MQPGTSPRHRDLHSTKCPHQRSRSMAMAVAGNSLGAIGILGISLWLAAIARARKHHLELGFDHCLDEAANLVAQSGFNRIKPVFEEGGPSSRLPTAGPAASCYHCSWRSLHRRANAGSFGFQSETTPHSIPTKPRTAPSRLAARWCG